MQGPRSTISGKDLRSIERQDEISFRRRDWFKGVDSVGSIEIIAVYIRK